MGKKAGESSYQRRYREYFWFALTLIVLSFCAASQRILSGQPTQATSLRSVPAAGVAR